jgi:hypothetical protein
LVSVEVYVRYKGPFLPTRDLDLAELRRSLGHTQREAALQVVIWTIQKQGGPVRNEFQLLRGCVRGSRRTPSK